MMNTYKYNFTRLNKNLFLITLNVLLLISHLKAQKHVVVLSPFEFTSSDKKSMMDEIYDSCGATTFDTGSTVTFDPRDCSDPILISMSAMRDVPDPFDPNSYSKDDVLVMGPPYDYQFNDEGMYVIFCDPSFKTIATCLTIQDDISGLGAGGAHTVPTLGQWSLIILMLLFINIALVTIRKSHELSNNLF